MEAHHPDIEDQIPSQTVGVTDQQHGTTPSTEVDPVQMTPPQSAPQPANENPAPAPQVEPVQPKAPASEAQPQSSIPSQPDPAAQAQTTPRQTQENPMQYAQIDPTQAVQPDPAAQTQTVPRQAQGNPMQYVQIDPTQQPVYTVMDPATGQLYYTHTPIMQQAAPPNPAYIQPPTPEEMAAAQQAQQAPPPDYGQVIRSVEAFAEGDASVGDVLKTLYTTTAQDDQFWKGALVGAAAAVLLTNDTVKGAMGKTLGAFMGGGAAAAAAEEGNGEEAPSPVPSPETTSTKDVTKK